MGSEQTVGSGRIGWQTGLAAEQIVAGVAEQIAVAGEQIAVVGEQTAAAVLVQIAGVVVEPAVGIEQSPG